MTSILYRMQTGIPGSISRESSYKTEAQVLSASTPFALYGQAGKMLANVFVPLTGVGDAIYGFLVRPYPTRSGSVSGNDPTGTSVPPQGAVIGDVMRSGYMSVKVGTGGGSPVAGAPVYVRYSGGTANLPVGGIEATSVGGSNVVVPGAYFMGPADGSGIAEISFNI